MTTSFKNRAAWVVEWLSVSRNNGLKEHELRPYILPRRWGSDKVFVFMQCLFWNSSLFVPTAVLLGINKSPHSLNTDQKSAYRDCNGARLFYGLLGDANHLVAAYTKDLCVTHQLDQFIVKWTRPAGARVDDNSGGAVPDGVPVERQWIWKRGQWLDFSP